MLVLHGSWVPAQGEVVARFVVWGENTQTDRPRGRRRTRAPAVAQPHPFAATVGQLQAVVAALPEGGGVPELEPRTLVARLPSAGGLPLPSPELAVDGAAGGEPPVLSPWTVEALACPPAVAPTLLPALTDEALPPGASLGDDLRYWVIAARFALGLLYRQRLLPAIENAGDVYVARWRPLFDEDADAERLGALVRSMPPVCRALSWADGGRTPPPRELLTGFLAAAVDAAARAAGQALSSPPKGKGGRRTKAAGSLGDAWLEALRGDPLVRASEAELTRFFDQYRTWAEPSDGRGAGPDTFRVCFRLDPPDAVPPDAGIVAPSAHARDWRLQYLLQATDDPSLLVPASEVWRQRGATGRFLNRKFDEPQERLLAGLGRASQLFPPIEASLRTARPEASALTAAEALGFLREASLLLKASGFGVLVPGLEAKLSVRARLTGKSEKAAGPATFSWQNLVNFDWQLSLGGEPLSRAEFEALARLKQPLVQIRGRWVELHPDQIEQALKLFQQTGTVGLSIPEAIKLALAPNGDLGLPIAEVVTEGWIDDLIRELRGGGRRERVAEPPGFVGQLRAYQKVGVSWMASLRRYGLGACLADDMGLGKCLSPDAPVFVNGTIMRAEDIWTRFAASAISDGEGEWALPTARLVTNALAEDDGSHRAVPAPISRLYRQQIRERLRRVTLDDGSEVLITRRHKLLGPAGWTNTIQPGDFVCVPSRLVWDGRPVDPDLVTLLAWQIAEGNELPSGELVITQSDTRVLERVRECALAFGARLGLRLNNPRVYCGQALRAGYLRINSVAYRHYLEGIGYPWGSRSAGKRIPDAVVAGDDETVRRFLREFFSAEGSVSKSMRLVGLTTASPWLIRQLSTMLRRFGVWLRISARQKCAANGARVRRTYYLGLIGGPSLRRFSQEVGFSNPDKQRDLEETCRVHCNTNTEGVPASDLLIDAYRATRLPMRHFGAGSVYFTGTQQPSRERAVTVVESLDRMLSDEAWAAYSSRLRSKWTRPVSAAYGAIEEGYLRDIRDSLATRVAREAFYARVTAVEEVDYEGWVYDFEVADHHNFVAGGMFCHNTIQVIALLLDQGRDRPAASGSPDPRPPTLLICPTSVVGNWQRELARFAPSLRVLVHHGVGRVKEDLAAEAARYDVVISTYALLHRDEAELAGVEWGNVILDEAQNVKNASTKAAQAARRLRAGWRAALTGTPVENRLSDLWSIFQFLNPGYLGSAEAFRKHFAIPIERVGDTTATTRLKSLVAPFILRRVKTDRSIIADLPEKNEMKVFCTLSREQATLYEAVVQDSIRQIEESEGVQRRGLILATLTKLKQVCDHPALFLHDRSELAGRSGKLARLGEMLEEVVTVGDRALIFTQYSEMGKLLKEHLGNTLGRDVLFLHGGTPAAERDRLVARFQAEGRGPQLFILSIKAGGTGLNLTRANHVFHFDRWWNPAVENQATDRAFRIGQRRDVQVHKFICAGTFEETIDQLIERKVGLAAAIVGAGESWITEMSTADLRDLFALRRDAVREE
ncbi:MAG: helicase [Chloroflexi bacterium]|nr:helicase [Chloroflexota bacterium]